MSTLQASHVGFAEVNGTRLHYEVAGQGHPLVLIHAGIADSRMWDDHMAVLAGSYRVVHYDLRGFGQSPSGQGEFSPHQDLLELLSFLGIEKAHLAGVSMGGALALDFTLEHPEMVSALVLVGARPSGTPPSEGLAHSWQEIGEVEEAGDIARAVEMELRLWVDGPMREADAVDPTVREKIRVMNTNNFVLAVEGAQPVPLDPPASGRLGEVRVPALIVVGEGDVADVVAAAGVLAEGIGGARKAILPNAAHMVTMEYPDAFNKILLEFLSS